MLDALHLALVSHVLYFVVVTNFGSLDAIATPTWSLSVRQNTEEVRMGTE